MTFPSHPFQPRPPAMTLAILAPVFLTLKILLPTATAGLEYGLLNSVPWLPPPLFATMNLWYADLVQGRSSREPWSVT
jgi:hypothetical protein